MQNLNLQVQHCNTVPFKKSTINVAISLYNNIPDQIKCKENVNSFKKDLKSFLLKNSFHSVDEFMPF
jgi:hypothetical protein